jgi:hypothetical protein
MYNNLKECHIKGYKIDRVKLLDNFPSRPNDPQNLRYMSLWEKFPEPFPYLTTGIEPEGIILVVVLADGYNREEVEQKPMAELSDPYTKVFTPGLWVRDD